MNSQETKKNLKAGLVGFILIVLVFMATLLRSESVRKLFFGKNDSEQKEVLQEKKQEAKTDNLAITPSELLKKIGDKETVVIDIRPSESFLTEHILDSLNFSGNNLLNSVSELDKAKEYVILDDGNDFSAQELANEIDQKDTLPKVYYLEGGFLAWKMQYSPTISFGDPLSLTDQAKVNYINSDELKKKFEETGESELFILDVRKPEEFSSGHLKNATNIFLEDLEKERKKIPRSKKIIVCDNDGFWAYMATVRLFDAGIKNTLTLSDGLNAWKEKGFETVQ